MPVTLATLSPETKLRDKVARCDIALTYIDHLLLEKLAEVQLPAPVHPTSTSPINLVLEQW